MRSRFAFVLAMFVLFPVAAIAQLNGLQISERQRANLLRAYPAADTNQDGELNDSELAAAFQNRRNAATGAPRDFPVNPGWEGLQFPEDAVCYREPDAIAAIYGQQITSHPKPSDGSLRIVGTGHSFMAPGYKTLPLIVQAAGFGEQVMVTHTGGGITGSARYKWEQENGIFQFAGRPKPKLLASISNAKWDAMMWGPYFNDRPEYYRCWIDFCLKYNPRMKFYLSDAWPQLYQLGRIPKSESELSAETIARLGRERYVEYRDMLKGLSDDFPNKIFLLPTCDAMVLAADYYHRGELPGVKGIHQAIGKEERSLWRDRLGHLGPGFERLEGYVFYATLYGKSPELIKQKIRYRASSDYPSPELDRIFRKIAWEATISNPLTGVTDEDGDGMNDK
ncbi:MAG: hypothetical protein ACPGLY_21930 [Rubripirellula sp.]